MTGRHEAAHGSIDSFEHDLVVSSLERDQLTEVKKQHFPRRKLKGSELVVLWSLRIYLLFMVAVVLYEVCTGAH